MRPATEYMVTGCTGKGTQYTFEDLPAAIRMAMTAPWYFEIFELDNLRMTAPKKLTEWKNQEPQQDQQEAQHGSDSILFP